MREFQGFPGFPRLTRRRVFGGASLLLGLMTLLVACSVPSGDTTGAVALATSAPFPTSTALATAATFTATLAPSATPTLRPQPTATPRPRPTATPRPRPTATPRPTPTATKVPTPTPTNPPETITINISGFAFSRSSVTIHVGDTVKWVNLDSTQHTTTSDTGDPASWNPMALNQNDTFSFTFTKSGTYTYHCSFHAFMKGTIIVTA